MKAASKKTVAKKSASKKMAAKKPKVRKPTEIRMQQAGQPDILYVEEPGGGFGAQNYTRGHPLTFRHEAALHHHFGRPLTTSEKAMLAKDSGLAKYPALCPDTKWPSIIARYPVDNEAYPAIEAKLAARQRRVEEQIREWLIAGGAPSNYLPWIEGTLNTAFNDARRLDRLAYKLCFTGWFRRQLLDSLETGERAWNVVTAVTNLPKDMKVNLGLKKAKAEKKNIDPALWNREFRETLRDGWTAQAALAKYADRICSMVKRGRLDALELLGQTISEHSNKPLKRSLEAWVKRAWLPLALWQCDIIEASNRLQAAHTVMSKSSFLNVIPFPVPGTSDKLRDAFERVGKSIKAGKR